MHFAESSQTMTCGECEQNCSCGVCHRGDCEAEIPLSSLKIGEHGRIVRIDGARRNWKKFADVGLILGNELVMEAHAPLGGLFRVRVLGTSIAVPADYGREIYVCPLAAPENRANTCDSCQVRKAGRPHFRIALAGNPNCGKTSIFNALTGARQHVGNYAGVTVESKTGAFTMDGMEIELIDLPGVYSLSSSSPEEEVVFRELVKPGIDLILNVLDSTILQRSLYLTTQLAELHIPMYLVFNMSDDARRRGIQFDLPKLERYFGSPIVQVVGNNRNGVMPLLARLGSVLENLANHGVPMLTYGADADDAINAVAEKIDALAVQKYAHIPSRFFAIKLLERDSCVRKIPEFQPVYPEVEAQIRHLGRNHAIDPNTFMADRRYAMLTGACRNAISTTAERRREISDQIDTVMTSKFLGLPLFLLILYAAFYFTFNCARPFAGWIEAGIHGLQNLVASYWTPDAFAPLLRNLLVDGVIPGVGGVLVFLPNILFLFLVIAILEDSGYMARAAFVMDGVMRYFGLHGRSFVPLVLGFGCNVPAVMATRTIESRRDRTVTVMVLPMMSCGARLPIYALMIPAFFAQKYQATMMFLIYLLGVLFALGAAWLMKNTLFRGDGEICLLELPPYRMPSAKSLLLHMWDRTKMYLHKAGTIILFTSIVLYLCNTYPRKQNYSRDYDAQIAAALAEKSGQDDAMQRVKLLRRQKEAERLAFTFSGRVGRFLAPVFRPIGFDWKLTTANLAALSAKEIFVSQLGILYGQGAEESSEGLKAVLRKNYTPLQAFCVMLFALLSVPCIATLAVIRRELNSWKMMFLEAGGLFCLAYVVTFLVYQIGLLFRLGTA